MHINNLFIKELRDINNLDIKFGKKLTFIAGTNGTQKTTILGLLAQPFTFRHSKKVKYRTLVGKEFKTAFSEIHKFSKYDEVNNISYTLTLSDIHKDKSGANIKLPVQGAKRKGQDEQGYRFVVERGRKGGDGNFALPVIYLGLKRLFPLGEHTEDINLKDFNISNEYSQLYSQIHKDIFIDLSNDFFQLEEVHTTNKEYIGGKCSKYDTKGFSAGQDNIGQIITAILSFHKLKKDLGSKYLGGLLLIDEIEDTMHPQALENLINRLYKYCSNYDLQIIVTTHSLNVLKLALREEYKYDTKVIYLSKSRGELRQISEENFDEIEEDMTCKSVVHKHDVYAVCEDDEAKSFINNIFPCKERRNIEIISAKLGGEELRNIAKSGFKKIPGILVLLDGDKESYKNMKNICILPGGKSPEAIIYDFLYSQEESNIKLWGKKTKKMYFNGFATRPNNRKEFKKFYEHIKDIDKRAWPKFCKQWANDNEDLVKEFIMDFHKKTDYLKKEK